MKSTHPNKVMVFVHMCNLGLPKYHTCSKRIYLKSAKKLDFFLGRANQKWPIAKNTLSPSMHPKIINMDCKEDV